MCQGRCSIVDKQPLYFDQE
jgi:hypothetical protein